METVSALLDTGAEVSVVHQELAFKQNWKIFKTDVIVFGSCEDPLQIVGETYVMIVPEGDKLLDTFEGNFIKYIGVNSNLTENM